MAFSKFGEEQGMNEWSRKIHDILDEMAQRRFFHYRDSKSWQPATNVYETRTAYHICVELAGMTADEIDVNCREQTRVTISGQRRQPQPAGVEGPLSVHVMEIDEGPFRREIDLPEPVVVDAVEATYKEGYLWITLPKATTS
jgi:HSP20 family protein